MSDHFWQIVSCTGHTLTLFSPLYDCMIVHMYHTFTFYRVWTLGFTLYQEEETGYNLLPRTVLWVEDDCHNLILSQDHHLCSPPMLALWQEDDFNHFLIHNLY